VTFPSNIPNIPDHHWAAGVAPATSIAHKGAVAGAKVLAALGRRFPDRSETGRRSRDYVQEGDGWISVQVVSTAGPKPPTYLNKELMERYRPLLSKYHLKKTPKFE
jgi:aminobenzoyl-glutamate utilization protein B